MFIFIICVNFDSLFNNLASNSGLAYVALEEEGCPNVSLEGWWIRRSWAIEIVIQELTCICQRYL
jgi:hypothetical protein